MRILRFVARSLLASVFVIDGAKELADPELHPGEAERIASCAVPAAKRIAPGALKDRIPESPKCWGKINGAAKIIGGIGFVTGIARRPSAALLAATMLPRLGADMSVDKLETEEGVSSSTSADLALFGSVMLAALGQGKKRNRAKTTRKQRRAAKLAVVSA